jgi:hypothetical protein
MRSLSPLVLATAFGIAALGNTALANTVLGVTAVAGEQRPATPSAAPPAQAIDPAKLGVDLGRIRKGVDDTTMTPEEQRLAHGVRLNLHVQVFGEAPAPDFFENFDPVVGPVPYGAPTHQQVLDFLTPQEFRAPAANFFGLAMWLAQKMSTSGDRQRCEQELERYKSQVLAGMPVAAPSCAR